MWGPLKDGCEEEQAAGAWHTLHASWRLRAPERASAPCLVCLCIACACVRACIRARSGMVMRARRALMHARLMHTR